MVKKCVRETAQNCEELRKVVSEPPRLKGAAIRILILTNVRKFINFPDTIFQNVAQFVFVLKNRQDSQRLNETIKEFAYANGLTNFIFFNDPTIDTVKRIYDSLELNYNIQREWMSRVSTR